MAGDDWSTRDFEAFSLLVAHGLAFTNSSGYRVDRCGELPRYMPGRITSDIVLTCLQVCYFERKAISHLQECIAVSAFINNALIG
jgi:hypothetical protein